MKKDMNSQFKTTNKTKPPTTTMALESRRSPKTQSGARAVMQASGQGKEVLFELDASAAQEVLLAGDFTGWEKTPIKLRKSERGTWQTSVTLAPGQYRYRFVVDGQWRDDPRARNTRPNPFGTCDCVLEIS